MPPAAHSPRHPAISSAAAPRRPAPSPLPAGPRRERLAVLVAEAGFARVAEIAPRLGVSEVTVRSDLGVLEAEGLLRRVHGGAMAIAGPERRLEDSAARDAAVKRAIGVAVAELVVPGTSLFLDVGSTALAVADALVARAELRELTVVTNGLSIALALERAVPRFTVIVTGGTLRPLQHSLVDPVAISSLAGLRADLAIVGGNGVDADGRVSNVNLPEAEVKRAMLAASRRHLLAMDASKLGRTELGRIGELADFEDLVTGGPMPVAATAVLAAAAAAGCRVIRAL